MTDITWGEPIKVDGKRPAWLKDSDKCEPTWDVNYPYGCLVEAKYVFPWETVTSIRLPADHWAYTAINAGFEPWAGGDSAPDDVDWDEQVMFRTGTTDDNNTAYHWRNTGDCSDIIGYRKRTETNSTTSELEELRAFKAKALEQYPDLGPETPEMICQRIYDEWGGHPMSTSTTITKAFNAGREYERNHHD